MRSNVDSTLLSHFQHNCYFVAACLILFQRNVALAHLFPKCVRLYVSLEQDPSDTDTFDEQELCDEGPVEVPQGQCGITQVRLDHGTAAILAHQCPCVYLQLVLRLALGNTLASSMCFLSSFLLRNSRTCNSIIWASSKRPSSVYHEAVFMWFLKPPHSELVH